MSPTILPGLVVGLWPLGVARMAVDRRAPPWPAVVATTLRLWLRRRLTVPRGLTRSRWAVALAVLVALGTVAAVSLRSAVGSAPPARHHAAPGGLSAAVADPTSGAAAVGHEAALWVARQVSHGAMVACDPGMCRMLRAQGLAAGDLLVLGPGAAGLRLCDVVVATPTARDLVGSSLQRQAAPIVIASFGSGAERIDIRAVAPGGAAAYRAALAADRAARRTAAAQLVKSPRIRATAAARQDLLTGRVDSRLLITLAALAVSSPVQVVAFGGAAPRASAGVPLREMDITGTGSPAARLSELRRIRSFVLAQRAVFLPAQASLMRLAGGGPALHIAFGAPSPLGLLRGRPVTQ